MKRPALTLAGMAFVLAIIFSSQAQKATTPLQSMQSVSAEDLAVMLQAVEATTPGPAESAPRGGNFYSAQFPSWPPLPCDINNVPVWNLGDGNYLLDDRDVDY